MLYADFEAFLVPAEENKESVSNTKVRQLHKPRGFACLRVSQVPEFNGEIFTYSGEDSMTVFFEHIRDQDHYVRSILSDVKPMKTLTADNSCNTLRLQPANCATDHSLRKTKRRNITDISADFTSVRIFNMCNLKIKYKKAPTPIRLPKREEINKKKTKQSSSTGHLGNA